MTNAKSDHDTNHDNLHDNDNDPSEAPAAVTPAGGALVSLMALGAALNAVDTASVVGRSGMPMLQFKRENNGTWMYGQKRTVAEEGAHWAVNPTTVKRGFICFGEGNKVLGEVLISVMQKKTIDPAELPDKGFPWVEQWAVNMKCLDGTDASIEAVYKPTTDGGIKAIAGLVETIRDRYNGGQHDGKLSPIVLLEKDSYSHSQFGKIRTPVLTIVDWMPMSGPARAPKPASPPPATEAPRRRRVG